MKEDYGLPDARTGHFPRLLLAAVVILGISLRAWGIGHHLPHRSYIEEDEFIYTALKYGTGDLNPHWYFHPPLYSYLLFTLYASLYAGGRVTGLYPDADAYIIGYLTDPSLWYLIARGLSALLFLPSLWLIYLIGKRVVSAGGAIVACLFFAVMPLAVSTSHYGCTEQLLILMALCAVWYSLRAAREGGVRNAILAGAFAGLAAGTKYTGVFALLPPCAAFLGGGRGSLRIFAASLTAAACAFLLVCPFPILSPREYFANIALLLSQPLSVGEYGWVRVRELHAAFFTHYLPAGMGAPLAWISVAGIIWLWLRRRREDCVVAVIPTAFFMITGFSSLFYDRYLLICYPFLAIAAAVLIDTVSSLSGRRRGPLLALLSVALAYPSCVASVRAVSTLVLPDTAAIAAAWIEANLPRGTRIFAEPIPLALSEASIVREQQLKVAAPRRGYGYRDETEHFFDLQRRAVRMRGGLDITWIRFPRGFYMEGSGKGYEEEWLTPEFMASQMGDLDRYDCVLVSEYGSVRFGDPGKLPGRFRFMGRFYRRLAGRGRLVKRFVPLPGESQGGIYLLYDLRARSDR